MVRAVHALCQWPLWEVTHLGTNLLLNFGSVEVQGDVVHGGSLFEKAG